jgi:hypothetical protein
VNERTIWSIRQNHPELVVQDCRIEFGLNDKQCDRLRFIMMSRGINKWLLARRKFITLKHDMKILLKNPKRLDFLKAYERMQNICKMPRWVEWPKHVHKNMRTNEIKIIIKGRHC